MKARIIAGQICVIEAQAEPRIAVCCGKGSPPLHRWHGAPPPFGIQGWYLRWLGLAADLGMAPVSFCFFKFSASICSSATNSSSTSSSSAGEGRLGAWACTGKCGKLMRVSGLSLADRV